MKKFVAFASVLVAMALMALAVAQNGNGNGNGNGGDFDPPALGIHWAKGEAHSGGAGSNADMTYHGGTIMPTSDVTAIFWGSSWGTSPGDKIAEIGSFYNGFMGSTYAGASDEYTGSNGGVTSGGTYHGYVIDTGRAAGGNRTSAILREVCQAIPNPTAGAYYPVYTDLPRSGNYCAYHSWGSCNGVQIQFAFFWKLDGDAGCDPGDSSGQRSQGAAALGNVSAHELSEARTDPRGSGWFDNSGAENGDKCAWTFPPSGLSKLSNGSQWKLQGEWSNNAYNGGTGYPNSSGQPGCMPK